jgi:hypothetical protein
MSALPIGAAMHVRDSRHHFQKMKWTCENLGIFGDGHKQDPFHKLLFMLRTI